MIFFKSSFLEFFSGALSVFFLNKDCLEISSEIVAIRTVDVIISNGVLTTSCYAHAATISFGPGPEGE